MKWIKGIDVPFLVPNSDAVLAEEEKFRMRNGKFLTVGRANRKRPEPAAKPLFQFLHVHTLNVPSPLDPVKILEQLWYGFVEILSVFWEVKTPEMFMPLRSFVDFCIRVP